MLASNFRQLSAYLLEMAQELPELRSPKQVLPRVVYLERGEYQFYSTGASMLENLPAAFDEGMLNGFKLR